jgi:hypothetical protein
MPASEGSVAEQHPSISRDVRIAIISTPRTGNTWLMHLLSTLCDIPAQPVPNPTELDWSALPPGCVLQIHWRRTADFVAQLEKHRFHVIVLMRHPLDVLISVLHFALHNTTVRWLNGEGGDERSIFGAMPGSAAFLAYATGTRAAALLSISPEWWQAAGHRLFYEDLNHDPAAELQRLVDTLGVGHCCGIAETVEANTIGQLRQRSQNSTHFWLGRPNLWRSLLTAAQADAIVRCLPFSLNDFGYSCDADPLLRADAADAAWIKLVWFELAGQLHGSNKGRYDLWQTQQTLAHAHYDLGVMRQDLAQTQQDLAAVREDLRVAKEEASRKQQELNASQESLRDAKESLRINHEALVRTQEELGAAQQACQGAQQALEREQQAHHATRAELNMTRANLQAAVEECACLRRNLEAAHRAFHEAENWAHHLEGRVEETAIDLEETRKRLASFENLGRLAIGVARKVHRLSRPASRAVSALRRTLRPS